MADNNESQYKLTEQQLAQIEAEIKSSQPLTSQLLPIDALVQQYSSNNSNEQKQREEENEEQDRDGFLTSSLLLSKKYSSLRRIRGDGNCYYRAFLYSLCEHLLQRCVANSEQLDEYKRIKQFVSDSLAWVCTLGYEECTIEMFHEELMDLFDLIEQMSKNTSASTTATASSSSALHDKLNEENSTSDYCTWYLRVLTAAQMKSNPDRYLPFLLAEDTATGSGMMDIPTFCSREVEPMNRECGMVQVAALAECFGVGVKIEYMDGRIVQEKDSGSGTRKVACHEFGQDDDASVSGKKMNIALLYRPGHYDVLY